ncbi:hypothetical protein [Rheinheimera aquimaris]|uniref:hypothetical protein n=1 Tax=Rheinheimera aquimaris TaxID=412437 RepID=UPI003A97D2D1
MQTLNTMQTDMITGGAVGETDRVKPEELTDDGGTMGYVGNNGGVYSDGKSGTSRPMSGFEKAVLATITFVGAAQATTMTGGAAATFVGTMATEAKVGGGLYPSVPGYTAP